MKIRKGSTTEQYLENLRKRQDQQALDHATAGANRKKRGSAVESDISLGRQINDTLNVEQLLAERKAKLEDLKQKVQNGEYNPPLEGVAKAVSAELSYEISEARVEEV